MQDPSPDVNVDGGPRADGPGFWPLVVMPLACVPLALIVAGVLINVLTKLGVGTDAAEAVTQFVGSVLILGLALVLRRGSPSHKRRLTTATRRPAFQRVLVGIPIGIGMTAVAVTIIGAGTAVDHRAKEQLDKLSDLYVPSQSIWQQVLLGLALVVLAPLGEELLFRGLVLRALVTRIPFAAAAPVSGALFAASHPDAWLLWPRALALVILGTILALTYRRFGYRGSVSAHATLNAVAFVSLLGSS